MRDYAKTSKEAPIIDGASKHDKTLTVLWFNFGDLAKESSSSLFGTGGFAFVDLIPSDFPMGVSQYLK